MTARTTRRQLFGVSAAAVLFGAAGEGKAAELDGRLLALTAQLVAVQERIIANDAASAAARGDREAQFDLDDELDDLRGKFWEAADAIVAIPARTPEGLQAKARVARIVHQSVTGNEEDHIAQHLLGLVRDMVGEG